MVMLKRIVTPLVVIFAVASAAPVLADTDPTPHQVYEAAENGHLDQAQQMINQVLKDHPTNARAHFIDAELAARTGNLSKAREELSRAQQLSPGLPFEKPEAVAALQRELARGSGYRTLPAPHAVQARSPVSWGLVLLIVAGVAILWTLMRRRSQPQYGGYPQQYPGAATAPGGMPGGYGPGGGYGAPGMGGGGMGSGIVGGLATGLAVGAGVAAGEELVRHVMDGREGGAGVIPAGGDREPPPENGDMGGSDFGSSDGGSSWDDGGGSFGGGDSGGGGGGGDWS
jgi:uncharacterized protein